ncbi:MAG: iron-containing alcohol dehydrogenase [Pseudomonadota bacterium]
MTLITYLNRVHFADGVLEEALRAELELREKRRPLIVAEMRDLDGALAERFFSSFPIRTSAEAFATVPGIATEAAAMRIAQIYHETGRDTLVAFGAARAIDTAKIARVAIAYDEPLAALSNAEGGTRRIGDRLPDLYAVPGIGGFASAVSDYARAKLNNGGQVLLSSRNLLPTVTICDPTLTLGSSAAAGASAASGTMSRGIESYLSRGFNPPADGLALDGLGRTVRHMARALEEDDLGARREMMAGSLNTALSLQKGHCAIHAITNALASVSGHAIDPCAVGRLLLPGVLRHYAGAMQRKAAPLRMALGLGESADLSDGVAAILADLPLPDTLGDMGLSAADLAAAAETAARDRATDAGPRPLGAEDLHAMLAAVHR